MFPLLKNAKKSAFWGEYDKGYYGNFAELIHQTKIIKIFCKKYFIMNLIYVNKYRSINPAIQLNNIAIVIKINKVLFNIDVDWVSLRIN